MSAKDLETVFLKLLHDEKFRLKLKTHPEEALKDAGVHVDPARLQAIANLPHEQLKHLASAFGHTVSSGGIN